MRYPFTPELLDAIPEEAAELFRALELTLLEDIARRLTASGKLNEVAIGDIKALRSHGVDLAEIKKAIRTTAGVSTKTLDAAIDDVIRFNEEYYGAVVTLADITKPDILVDAATIAAIRKQTQETFRNITRSMGFLVDAGRTMLAPAKAYQWALDNAVMQMQSGAVSYGQAIANATRQLADSGLKVVEYESGHVDQADVAVRRAIMTGIGQINAQYNAQGMETLQTDLVEVSAHAGARNTGEGFENHEDWQGKIYRWAEYAKKFPGASAGDYLDFEETCGLGDVQGIYGANCRHWYSPFVEGVMTPTYSQEGLDRLKAKTFTYEGKEYDTYTATQKQREIERSVRHWKRREAAATNKEDKLAAQARVRILKQKYAEFSKAAHLRTQPERMKAYVPKSTGKAAANGG